MMRILGAMVSWRLCSVIALAGARMWPAVLGAAKGLRAALWIALIFTLGRLSADSPWTTADAALAASSRPIVITRGGTYSGSWRSSDPAVPVVTIKTTQPVTIRRSRLEGPGKIITGNSVNLAVRDNTVLGDAPTAAAQAQGRFIEVNNPTNLSVSNNAITGTIGIVVRDFVNGSGPVPRPTFR